MTLGEYIRKYRLEHGLSQRQFAEKCGNITHGYLAIIESGRNPNTGKKTIPSIDKLYSIASGMNLSLHQLLESVDDMDVQWSKSPPAPPPQPLISLPNAIPYTPARAMVPIVGSVRCGPGGLAYQELQGSELADVANPSEYFYLRAEGDSMLPDIRPGDLVLVHIQPEVDSGQLAVVTIDGDSEEGALKKYILKDNALILQSFNQAYPPRVFVGEEMTAVHVCGRVVETKRKW